MFHEFVEQNRKNIKCSWHQLNVKFGSLTHIHIYLRALSDILLYSRMLEGCFPGIPSSGDYHLRRASKNEGQNSWRFPSIKLLKVERYAVSQCSPWEALPCFLSLTQLCNGKSIWLYSLFVFGSKPCPFFVHTVMHFSRFHSSLFVCFSWSALCRLSQSVQLRDSVEAKSETRSGQFWATGLV